MSYFDQQLDALIDRVEKKLHTVPQLVAEMAVEHFQNALIQKQWNGNPYLPYKNKAREPSRGSLMQRDLNLFRSIKPSMVTAERVIISSGGMRAPYARVHNEGLRVRTVQNVRGYHNNNFSTLLSLQVNQKKWKP